MQFLLNQHFRHFCCIFFFTYYASYPAYFIYSSLAPILTPSFLLWISQIGSKWISCCNFYFKNIFFKNFIYEYLKLFISVNVKPGAYQKCIVIYTLMFFCFFFVLPNFIKFNSIQIFLRSFFPVDFC